MSKDGRRCPSTRNGHRCAHDAGHDGEHGWRDLAWPYGEREVEPPTPGTLADALTALFERLGVDARGPSADIARAAAEVTLDYAAKAVLACRPSERARLGFMAETEQLIWKLNDAADAVRDIKVRR